MVSVGAEWTSAGVVYRSMVVVRGGAIGDELDGH